MLTVEAFKSLQSVRNFGNAEHKPIRQMHKAPITKEVLMSDPILLSLKDTMHRQEKKSTTIYNIQNY